MLDEAPSPAPKHHAIVPIIAIALGLIGVITPLVLVLADYPFTSWLYIGGAIGLLGLFLAMTSQARSPRVLAIMLNIIALLFSLSSAAITRTDPHAARTRCQANLRALGMSIMQYAAEHDGRYPPSLDLLTDPPTSPTRCTYLYIPPTAKPQPDTILIYEPLHDHNDGINILFADLHVEFRNPTEARALLTMQNLKLVQ